MWCEKGDVSSPLPFSFGEVYVIRQSTEAHWDLELNGMYQFLIYANYINLLGTNFRRLAIKQTNILLHGDRELNL